jgi:hypothetical protein
MPTYGQGTYNCRGSGSHAAAANSLDYQRCASMKPATTEIVISATLPFLIEFAQRLLSFVNVIERET